MEIVLLGLVVVFPLLVAFKTVFWLWLKPMKMKKYLKKQGIDGPSYKFFHGNHKESEMMKMKARSKPMELSHCIVPRLLPFQNQALKTYGKMFVSWNGPTPRVNIMDPTMIRDILSTKFADYTRVNSNPLMQLLAKGVVTYQGDKWVKHRRILNPAFHQEKLKMMFPAFYACCSELVEKWEKLVSKEPCEVDVWPYLHNLAADVISRTAFGSSYEEGRRIFELQTEQMQLAFETSRSVYFPGFRNVPTKRNRRMKEIYREIYTLLIIMIKKRKMAMESGEASSNDLLGILMESNVKEMKDSTSDAKNVGLTIDDVVEECKLFYFAGQETTSTLLVWTMIVLCMHPEWQQKAREEVRRVFGQKNPDFEGLNHLKVVTMIFNEVLRLYPPVVMLVRATYITIELGNVHLPPDVELALPILLVHHDRELWGEDAEEFNPERFSEGVSKATNGQVSFFPFSWGPKICIGQNFAFVEAKMALAMILQKFSFELSPSYTHSPTTVLILQPQHGAPLILHKL